jgi:uroporphyrinogen-III synthase
MSELQGKRVVVTRPRAQANGFAEALERAGAEAIFFPVIEITPVEDMTALDHALLKLYCYDWLILTSVNGVRVVWDRMHNLDIQGGLPEKLRVATIGPKTAAELKKFGVKADFIPDEYVAEAILLGLGDLRGCWTLLPRADIARPALPDAINAAGGVAHEIGIYHTLPAEADRTGLQALREGVDFVTFTSSSTVRNFSELVKTAGLDAHHLPGNPQFACIGPITAQTAREEGFPVAVVAEEYTTEGLLQALIDYAAK